MTETNRGFIQLHLSVLLAGFTGLFGKVITLHETDIVWYRMLFTTAILVTFTGLPRVGWRKLLQLAGCGGLLGLHWMLFYASIKASNVSIGVICFSLVGFFTALFEPLLLRRRLSWVSVLFSLVTVAGILCVFSFDVRYRYGILIGVVSAAVCAVYAICNKQVSVGLRSRTVLLYQMGCGLLVVSMIIPVYLWFFPSSQPVLVVPEGRNLWLLLAMALFCTVGMYLLQIQALKCFSAFTVNLTYNLEPCYSIIMAFLFLGEGRELNFSFYIGITLILCSVLLQTWRARHPFQLNRNMVKLILTIVCMSLPFVAAAQKPKEELKQNLCLSASNFLAYRGPLQPHLTPAPAGTAPFYISHYGRHGSRYMSKTREYHFVYDILLKACRLRKLTELGEDVLERVKLISEEAENRTGELTPLGVEQQRDIARRMMERFPEVFEDDATIDARSTLSVRCILSMQSALLQLVSMNPKLRVTSDASMHDMYFMNLMDKDLVKNVTTGETRPVYNDYCRRRECWQRPIGQLFNDTAYVNHAFDAERMNYYLFRMASNVQNMEVRKQLTLYDLFTDDEILSNWQTNNAFWFLGYSHTPLNGGQQPFTQRNLLRRIIQDADSCIQLPHPGATLRFGHDTVVLPLVCLLDLNGYGKAIDDLEKLEKLGWVDYRVFSMSCNVQFVFYRKSADDTDVLFKVLLNEDEATLPLKAVQGPYYRWADFREYYLKKLDSYVAE